MQQHRLDSTDRCQAQPVAEVSVGRSGTLFVMIVAGHLLAGVAIWLAALPPGIAMALSVVVLFSAVAQTRRRAGLSSAQSRVSCILDDAGTVRIRRADGSCDEGHVQPSTFVAPWLTIVRYRASAHARVSSVLLTADNCDPAAFRRLRVALCWRPGASPIAHPRQGLN